MVKPLLDMCVYLTPVNSNGTNMCILRVSYNPKVSKLGEAKNNQTLLHFRILPKQ